MRSYLRCTVKIPFEKLICILQKCSEQYGHSASNTEIVSFSEPSSVITLKLNGCVIAVDQQLFKDGWKVTPKNSMKVN